MKKLIRTSQLLILLSLFTLHSCRKEIKDFDGTWNVTSWIDDGDEAMGSNGEFTSVKMVFDSDDKDHGTVTFKIVDVTGLSYSVNSKFSLDTKDDKITISFDGDLSTFSYVIDDNTLSLDANDAGIETHIKATKE